MELDCNTYTEIFIQFISNNVVNYTNSNSDQKYPSPLLFRRFRLPMTVDEFYKMVNAICLAKCYAYNLKRQNDYGTSYAPYFMLAK